VSRTALNFPASAPAVAGLVIAMSCIVTDPSVTSFTAAADQIFAPTRTTSRDGPAVCRMSSVILTVADIRAGLISDRGAPVTGNDASTAETTIEQTIHFNVKTQLSKVRKNPLLAATATMSVATKRNATVRLLC
jgi:hypothetical protein